MREDFHVTLALAGRVGAAAEGRAQAAFEPREDTLGLGPLGVLLAVEAAFHLAAIEGLGPAAAAAGVELDDRGADAQALAGQPVVGLGVEAAVAQQPVDVQVPRRLDQRRLQERAVVRRPHRRQGRGDQVAPGIADHGELGELAEAVAAVAVAEAAGVVGRADAGLQAGRVDRRLGLAADQPRRSSIVEDRLRQAAKDPFFARRWRAWNSVVGCGTFVRPKAARRSDQSLSNATMPRSSVLKNCSSARMASSWCCVKSCLEYLDEYAGIASAATSRAFLTNATGERVATRRRGR